MKNALLRLALVVSALAGLTSCMSSGLSSAAKLAALSPLDANPAEFRVALYAPTALRLKTGDARLGFGWSQTGSVASTKVFDLEIVSGKAGSASVLPPLRQGQQAMVLSLGAREADSVLKFQQAVREAKEAGQDGRGNISVSLAGGCWSEPFPVDDRPLPLDIWLQASAGSEYIPVIRDVDLRTILKQAGLKTVPQCVNAS